MKFMFGPSYVYIRKVKRTCCQLLLKSFELVSVLFLSFFLEMIELLPLKQNLWCSIFRLRALKNKRFNERVTLKICRWFCLQPRRHLQCSVFRKSMILFTLPVKYFVFTLNLRVFLSFCFVVFLLCRAFIYWAVCYSNR